MLPTEIFAVRILSSLIPKSLRAGVMLAVTLVVFPFGLSELVNVLLGQANGWGMLKCAVGVIVGGAAGIIFYYFQAIDGKPKVGDLELINQYHKDQRRNFEVVWSSEDQTNKDTKQR